MPVANARFREFVTLSEASLALAEAVAEQLCDAIRARGQALIAVPGGSTPRRFLEALALQAVDWRSIIVMPTDERRVRPDDPQSNERMIRTCFGPVGSGTSAYVSLHDEAADPERAATRLSDELARMPPLDVLVSGMGEDGHIASLFPGDANWGMARAETHVVAGYPDGLVPRLSLSPSRLRAARWTALLVAGKAKQDVLKAVLEGTRDLPVALLLDNVSPARIFWARET